MSAVLFSHISPQCLRPPVQVPHRVPQVLILRAVPPAAPGAVPRHRALVAHQVLPPQAGRVRPQAQGVHRVLLPRAIPAPHRVVEVVRVRLRHGVRVRLPVGVRVRPQAVPRHPLRQAGRVRVLSVVRPLRAVVAQVALLHLEVLLHQAAHGVPVRPRLGAAVRRLLQAVPVVQVRVGQAVHPVQAGVLAAAGVRHRVHRGRRVLLRRVEAPLARPRRALLHPHRAAGVAHLLVRGVVAAHRVGQVPPPVVAVRVRRVPVGRALAPRPLAARVLVRRVQAVGAALRHQAIPAPPQALTAPVRPHHLSLAAHRVLAAPRPPVAGHRVRAVAADRVPPAPAATVAARLAAAVRRVPHPPLRH